MLFLKSDRNLSSSQLANLKSDEEDVAQKWTTDIKIFSISTMRVLFEETRYCKISINHILLNVVAQTHIFIWQFWI
jgi:hypothetical protein